MPSPCLVRWVWTIVCIVVRFIWRRRVLLPLSCLAVYCLTLLHKYSNILDIIAFYIFLGVRPLPLTLHCNEGELDNQMCSYATLYGLSALNNRRSFAALSCNMEKLLPYFPRLNSYRIAYHSRYPYLNPWQILPYLKPGDEAIPSNFNFIAGYEYPCSFTFFDHVKEEIRDVFRFREDLEHFAARFIKKANVYGLQNVTYVGVHVRRGGYHRQWLDVLQDVPLNYQNFQKAFNYFRNKYTTVVFVTVSDDPLWCIENLSIHSDVYVVDDTPSPAHDMAILAACDHTVLTYGTFGFWGAYLAGGEVLYLDKLLRPGEQFILEKMYPPLWMGIISMDASYGPHRVQKTAMDDSSNSYNTFSNIAWRYPKRKKMDASFYSDSTLPISSRRLQDQKKAMDGSSNSNRTLKNGFQRHMNQKKAKNDSSYRNRALANSSRRHQNQKEDRVGSSNIYSTFTNTYGPHYDQKKALEGSSNSNNTLTNRSGQPHYQKKAMNDFSNSHSFPKQFWTRTAHGPKESDG